MRSHPGIIHQVVHARTCNMLMSLLTSDFCFLCCTLISEAKRGNVAVCNPIGIDFNQDNVPACLVTVSERHETGKDHLLNVPRPVWSKTVPHERSEFKVIVVKLFLTVALINKIQTMKKNMTHQLIILMS